MRARCPRTNRNAGKMPADQAHAGKMPADQTQNRNARLDPSEQTAHRSLLTAHCSPSTDTQKKLADFVDFAR